VTASGAIKCWGRDAEGELGDGTTVNSAVPVDAAGLASGEVAVTAGGFHSCARTSAGTVRCWGDNGNGQLGAEAITNSAVPIRVVGLG
jgi:alpha-tubulin suppressor-like RCC1 family protein